MKETREVIGGRMSADKSITVYLFEGTTFGRIGRVQNQGQVEEGLGSLCSETNTEERTCSQNLPAF